MSGIEIDENHHVSRYCKPRFIDDGLPIAEAFALRDKEEYLSVNWLEYFDTLNLTQAVDCVRQVFLEDSRAIWLEHVWLLATKFQIGLICLRGGLSKAAEVADKAVQELELDTPDIPIVDAFDPFAFGSSGDDIGIALTLTAILKVVHEHSDADECPPWWTDTIHSLVEEPAEEDSDKIFPSEEDLSNHFGLATPLCVRIIAQQLIKFLPISR